MVEQSAFNRLVMGSSPISLIQMKKERSNTFTVVDGVLFLSKKHNIVGVDKMGKETRQVPLDNIEECCRLVSEHPGIYSILPKSLRNNKQIKSTYLMSRLGKE